MRTALWSAALLLAIALCYGHDSKKIKTLNKKINRKYRQLKMALDEAKTDLVTKMTENDEKVKSELKDSFVDMMKTVISETLKSLLTDSVNSRNVSSEELGQTRETLKLLERTFNPGNGDRLRENSHRIRKIDAKVNEVRARLKKVEKENTRLKEAIVSKCQCKKSRGEKRMLTSSPAGVTSSDTATLTTPPSLATTEFANVFAVGVYDHKLHQFPLDNKRDDNYRTIRVEAVLDMTYDVNDRKVIWSNASANGFEFSGIYSMSLDTGPRNTLKTGFESYGVTIDTSRGLIFYSTYKPKVTVNVMSKSGEGHEQVADLTYYGKYAYKLNVQAKKRQIFICLAHKILMMNYKGKGKRILVSGELMFALALDSLNGVLYYNHDHGNIKRYSIDSGKNELVAFWGDAPWTLFYTDRKLYVSFWAKNNISVYNTMTDSLSRIGHIDSTTVSICLVP